MLTRKLAYSTIGLCLLLSAAGPSQALAKPEMDFPLVNSSESKITLRKIILHRSSSVAKVPSNPKQLILKYRLVPKTTISFMDRVKKKPIRTNIESLQNLAGLFTDLKTEMVASNEFVRDEVKTNMAAASKDAEPEFFEYPTEPSTASTKDVELSTFPESINGPEAVDNSNEEVAIDDLLAFDYSKAGQDTKGQSSSSVGKLTTQALGASANSSNSMAPSQNMIWEIQKRASGSKANTTNKVASNTAKSVDVNNLMEEKAVDNLANNVKKDDYSSTVTIQISGTDLLKSKEEVGFEVRFQDDLTETLQDHNTGFATTENKLNGRSMTRAVTILKHGYAPTNTELIITNDNTTVTLPILREDKFNELLAPFKARGELGSVLVELDETVKGASLDAPFSQVLNLDENMVVTEKEDFSYQLFVGVKAGNAVLSYKDKKDKVLSKVIHIHERELTFDSYYIEAVKNEKVALVEEDLLSNEITPLIISSDEVKEFTTGKTTNKVDNHTYVTDFGKTLLGGRKYLEIAHLQEPVFMGYKEKETLVVPTEAFMRHIVSKFEGSSLGNRCVVQLNLSKPAAKVDLAAQSLDTSIMTYTQFLDTDGKFYDTVGPKTKKVIVVGENQGASSNGQDGKINVKVSYEDGTVEFLGSYCSPNTYLVEQL